VSFAYRSAAGRWVLGVAIVGSCMAFLDGTIVNAALPAALVAATAHHVRETRDPEARGPLDVRGAALAALAPGGTTFVLIEGPGRGLTPRSC
jgi:hypothetical protein